jgi:hypothetical protein
LVVVDRAPYLRVQKALISERLMYSRSYGLDEAESD